MTCYIPRRFTRPQTVTHPVLSYRAKCYALTTILSYRLTTCYGLHQKTSFVSIRPHSSAHSGDSSTQRPTLPSWPSVRSFTWQGLETLSWSSSRVLDRPTPQRHWICSWRQAILRGHGRASWLRDDDYTIAARFLSAV